MPMPKRFVWPEMNADYLRSIMDYDGSVLRWKEKRGSNALKGQIAGKKRPDGYIQIKIDRKMYLAHRLIWMWVYGSWPRMFLDHINMDKADNRIGNLRNCSRSQNGFNRGKQKNNSCGIKGVYKAENKYWKAQIYVSRKGKKKLIYLGLFPTKEQAGMAYKEASKKYHGEFARV